MRNHQDTMGIPTIAERPKITHSFPDKSTWWRRNNSIHPAGVQGVAKGCPDGRDNCPKFTAVKPSASFSTAMASMTRCSSICLGNGNLKIKQNQAWKKRKLEFKLSCLSVVLPWGSFQWQSTISSAVKGFGVCLPETWLHTCLTCLETLQGVRKCPLQNGSRQYPSS